jgi:hypothetical protein
MTSRDEPDRYCLRAAVTLVLCPATGADRFFTRCKSTIRLNHHPRRPILKYLKGWSDVHPALMGHL